MIISRQHRRNNLLFNTFTELLQNTIYSLIIPLLSLWNKWQPQCLYFLLYSLSPDILDNIPLPVITFCLLIWKRSTILSIKMLNKYGIIFHSCFVLFICVLKAALSLSLYFTQICHTQKIIIALNIPQSPLGRPRRRRRQYQNGS
jgi:hypothetical protein